MQRPSSDDINPNPHSPYGAPIGIPMQNLNGIWMMMLQRNEDWIWNIPNEQGETAENGIKLKRSTPRTNQREWWIYTITMHNIWIYRNNHTAVYLKEMHCRDLIHIQTSFRCNIIIQIPLRFCIGIPIGAQYGLWGFGFMSSDDGVCTDFKTEPGHMCGMYM